MNNNYSSNSYLSYSYFFSNTSETSYNSDYTNY